MHTCQFSMQPIATWLLVNDIRFSYDLEANVHLISLIEAILHLEVLSFSPLLFPALTTSSLTPLTQESILYLQS